MVMTVKYLTDLEKAESRSLWEEAFPEDSRAFLDYYFSEKVKDNQILAIAEAAVSNSKRPPKTSAAVRQPAVTQRARSWHLESMLQRNPYQVQVRGLRWNTDYVVGVATCREKRHRGYMSTLLTKMLKDMKEEHMAFCFLMPAKEEIYKPFGFSCVSKKENYRWKADAQKGLKRKSLLPWSESDEYRRRLKETAQWMNDWLDKKYMVHTVRSEAYLYRLLMEIASEDGILDVYYDGDQIAGIYSEWGIEKRETRLLYAQDRYVERVEAAGPVMMARITSPEVFVKAIHLNESADTQELKIRLKLEDMQIDENNRSWLWCLDKKSSRLERVYEDAMVRVADRARPDIELSVEELTSWLLGGTVPEAAMKYADLIDPLTGIFLDEIV